MKVPAIAYRFALTAGFVLALLTTTSCSTRRDPLAAKTLYSPESAVVPQALHSLDLALITATMPKGWQMSQPEPAFAPIGFSGTTPSGIKLCFAGRRTIRIPGRSKGGGQRLREHFYLWIMPAEYVMTYGEHLPQVSAVSLGKSDRYSVSMGGWGPQPSWNTWQKDIAEALDLNQKLWPGAR